MLAFDYAVIKLKKPIEQDKYPSLLFLCQECLIDNKNLSLEVYGFPQLQDNFKSADENEKINQLYQYGLSRRNCFATINKNSSRINNKISTGAGQSGCPVVIGDSTIAVHLGGVNYKFNVGRMVDSTLINNVVKWRIGLNG